MEAHFLMDFGKTYTSIVAKDFRAISSHGKSKKHPQFNIFLIFNLYL